ncbi:hypothetical protein M976_00123 [Buttiauxella ferragutiae ATCC 51602]|jgi:hypothetical protein|uniref:Uncharacterized protein n=1 Tax=Buttiauxella ferragutiae ATCC 51602 TaxID=1354252 RepID=A0ABX2WDZ9_9ENTR|nr:hypothetical protein M976_00123 [Buttiauxella ferragutiae ATCC 51602]
MPGFFLQMTQQLPVKAVARVIILRLDDKNETMTRAWLWQS